MNRFCHIVQQLIKKQFFIKMFMNFSFNLFTLTVIYMLVHMHLKYVW